MWFGLGRGLLKRGPAALRAAAGRYHAEIPAKLVSGFTCATIVDELRRPKKLSTEESFLEYINMGKRFCERVNRDLAKKRIEPGEFSFFGYDTGCLETMQMLRERGIACVVDQIDPGRVEEDLVMEEVERWPGWDQIEGRKPQAYWDRLDEEWRLADAVVVNSQWSKDALVKQRVAAEKIVVIPLAYEDLTNADVAKKSDGPLHVVLGGECDSSQGDSISHRGGETAFGPRRDNHSGWAGFDLAGGGEIRAVEHEIHRAGGAGRGGGDLSRWRFVRAADNFGRVCAYATGGDALRVAGDHDAQLRKGGQRWD